MTMGRYSVWGIATLVAVGMLSGCGEDGVSIGRGQCPALPRYNPSDLALDSKGHTIINPDVARDAGQAKIEQIERRHRHAQLGFAPQQELRHRAGRRRDGSPTVVG